MTDKPGLIFVILFLKLIGFIPHSKERKNGERKFHITLLKIFMHPVHKKIIMSFGEENVQLTFRCDISAHCPILKRLIINPRDTCPHFSRFQTYLWLSQ